MAQELSRAALCRSKNLIRLLAAIFFWSSSLAALGQLRITEFDLSGGKVHLSHTSDVTQYYILYRGDTVTAITFPRSMHLGAAAEQSFLDDIPNSKSAFFRILGVPLNQPRDSDGDGID